MKISFVIPVHNEEKIVEKVFSDLFRDLNKEYSNFEVIAVENGSTDSSLKILNHIKKKRKNLIVLHLEEGNFGNALKKGYNEAKGDLIIPLFVDWIDLKFVKEAIPLIKDYDIIVGTKTIGNNDRRPWIRRTISKVYNYLLMIFFGVKVTDTHCISVFRASKIKPIVKKSVMDGSVFPSEIVIRAQHAGFKITQKGIIVKEKRQAKKGITKRAIKAAMTLAKLRIILWKENIYGK